MAHERGLASPLGRQITCNNSPDSTRPSWPWRPRRSTATSAASASSTRPRSREPFTLEHLTEVVQSRLHLLPPFRRRLVEVPFGIDQPYWIEDPDFDIEFHVRELALPAPGDDKQLAEQAARLHARPLDRRRPLWELYLIHGLQGGQVAIYTKVHHAAIDGVSRQRHPHRAARPHPGGPGPRRARRRGSATRSPATSACSTASALSLAGQPLRAARLTYGLLRSLPRLAKSSARPRLPIIDDLLGRDRSLMLPSRAAAGAGHPVQQVDHRAPPLGVPGHRPGRRQEGQERRPASRSTTSSWRCAPARCAAG